MQEPEDSHATPRVSPYRLAGHLASAFVIYGTLLWTTLTLALPQPPAATANAAAAMQALRRHALPLTALIALTAASGGCCNVLLLLLMRGVQPVGLVIVLPPGI